MLLDCAASLPVAPLFPLNVLKAVHNTMKVSSSGWRIVVACVAFSEVVRFLLGTDINVPTRCLIYAAMFSRTYAMLTEGRTDRHGVQRLYTRHRRLEGMSHCFCKTETWGKRKKARSRKFPGTQKFLTRVSEVL